MYAWHTRLASAFSKKLNIAEMRAANQYASGYADPG